LPSEYPFKPPEVYMLTPSGRFEINKKICLSISSFHPETWQPSWGIRTALVALMAFFESEAKGAVGSLDAPPAERQRMARSSRHFKCATCGFDSTKSDSFASLPAPSSTEAEKGDQVPQVHVATTPTVRSAVETDAKDASALAVAADTGGTQTAPPSRQAPPSSIETTIFPAAAPTVRSPSSARHHAREPQPPLDHNPFASAYAHHSHHSTSIGSLGLDAGSGNAGAGAGAGAYVPPGAPRLSPAHLPAPSPSFPNSHNPLHPQPGSGSGVSPPPPPTTTTTSDLVAVRSGPAIRQGVAAAAATGSGSGSPGTRRGGADPVSTSPAPRQGETTTDHQHQHQAHLAPQVRLPALPPGVSLAQVSTGGVGGPPSWVDRAIVACLLALVALVVRKIA
ncbi:hypothetical protein JCM3774_004567, partial [Rhodotorula dairenensis]